MKKNKITLLPAQVPVNESLCCYRNDNILERAHPRFVFWKIHPHSDQSPSRTRQRGVYGCVVMFSQGKKVLEVKIFRLREQGFCQVSAVRIRTISCRHKRGSAAVKLSSSSESARGSARVHACTVLSSKLSHESSTPS